MSASKIKGHIKETTGKLTGDTGMEVEGKIEKGVAEIKDATGGVVSYVIDIVSDLYEGIKRTIRNLLR